MFREITVKKMYLLEKISNKGLMAISVFENTFSVTVYSILS